MPEHGFALAALAPIAPAQPAAFMLWVVLHHLTRNTEVGRTLALACVLCLPSSGVLVFHVHGNSGSQKAACQVQRIYERMRDERRGEHRGSIK